MKTMIKTILFDLDGTLLPMDQDLFVKAYFSGLAAKAAPHGYETSELIKTIWAGTEAMVKNDGSRPNEKAFWNVFTAKYGQEALKDIVIFDDFYANEFEQIQKVCGCNSKVKTYVDTLKNMGYQIVLATNPLFPAVATEARIRWAGLCPKDFELYTTYETSCHCKPNPEYYKDILESLNAVPEECLMVGNDVDEDMVAAELGMQVFLLTDCLINKGNKDISVYPNGGFEDLMEYVKTNNLK